MPGNLRAPGEQEAGTWGRGGGQGAGEGNGGLCAERRREGGVSAVKGRALGGPGSTPSAPEEVMSSRWCMVGGDGPRFLGETVCKEKLFHHQPSQASEWAVCGGCGISSFRGFEDPDEKALSNLG